MKNMIRVTYPSLVGLMLGLFQTGLFFQLAFTLSSSFRTYLMVTICWLIGSAIGVQLARHFTLGGGHTSGLLLAALGAYFACAVLLIAAPFHTQLWPVYGLLVVITGLYPGVFFVRMGKVYKARDLFFWENNGFIVGIVATTLAFLLLGRGVLWTAPLILVVLILLIPEPVCHLTGQEDSGEQVRVGYSTALSP
jgi:hypothetical protein